MPKLITHERWFVVNGNNQVVILELSNNQSGFLYLGDEGAPGPQYHFGLNQEDLLRLYYILKHYLDK